MAAAHLLQHDHSKKKNKNGLCVLAASGQQHLPHSMLTHKEKRKDDHCKLAAWSLHAHCTLVHACLTLASGLSYAYLILTLEPN